MVVSGGALWSRNLADLAIENEPSPYWINDDDYVSEWVNTSPLPDVTRLSTSSKLKALNTLLGGSVSSDDLRAMTKICTSVKTKKEGDAIRKGIDVLRFTDLGQRTTFRIALSNMP
jgi:hypothetical protein